MALKNLQGLISSYINLSISQLYPIEPQSSQPRRFAFPQTVQPSSSWQAFAHINSSRWNHLFPSKHLIYLLQTFSGLDYHFPSNIFIYQSYRAGISPMLFHDICSCLAWELTIPSYLPFQMCRSRNMSVLPNIVFPAFSICLLKHEIIKVQLEFFCSFKFTPQVVFKL